MIFGGLQLQKDISEKSPRLKRIFDFTIQFHYTTYRATL